MFNMKYFVLLVVFVTYTQAVTYKDCGSTVGKVKNVMVSGCPPQGACPLKKGTNVTFEIDFISKEVTDTVTSVVHGVIAGVPIPFPVSNPNACKNSGLVCPLKNAASYAFKTVLQVKSSYPALSLVVKWELKDGKGNDIICVELPAKITS